MLTDEELERRNKIVEELRENKHKRKCAQKQTYIERQKTKYLENIEEKRAYYRERYHRLYKDGSWERQRNKWIIRNYGITEADYDTRLTIQNGRCAICGKDNPGKTGKTGKRWHIDHDHVTGKVRGLLCRNCNVNVGVIENEKWMGLARAYLEK